jgi:hypothetical protein
MSVIIEGLKFTASARSFFLVLFSFINISNLLENLFNLS